MTECLRLRKTKTTVEGFGKDHVYRQLKHKLHLLVCKFLFRCATHSPLLPCTLLLALAQNTKISFMTWVSHKMFWKLESFASTAKNGPFFPSFVISQGAGVGTARGVVPTTLNLPDCLSPFFLFFLLEVEHHRGVRFSAINCYLIPKRLHTHTLARLISRKHMRMSSYKNLSHIRREVITLTF